MSVKGLAIALFLAIQPASPVSDAICSEKCEVSDAGVQLVRTFEGYSPIVYKDIAGLDTIGYGHLIRHGEKFDVLTPDLAERLLRKDLTVAENAVNRYVIIGMRQYQFDPQVSFVFNIGSGAYSKSTLLRKVNAERHSEVPGQFMRWINAGGKPSNGLVNRRTTEAEMYQGR